MGEQVNQARIPGLARRRTAGVRLAPVVTLSAVIVFHLVTLLRTPAPFVDDAWYASRAWALIQTGRAYGCLDAGVFERFAGYWTILPALYAWLESLAIRALGLSLLTVRMVSLAAGLVLSGAVYASGRHLGGKSLGWVAALLTLLSTAFLYSAHLARPDICVAAMGFTAIALYITDTRPGFTIRSVLSGLCVGLAFELHPNGMIFGPVILALILIDGGWRALASWRLWGFAAGVCAGLALYAALHILPYPQSYQTFMRLIFGPWRTPPALTLDPRLWLKSATDMLVLLLVYDHLRTPLILVGGAFLAWKGTSIERKTLLILGLLYLACVALIRVKLDNVTILVSPATDLVLATVLCRLGRAYVARTNERRWSIRDLATVSALGLLLAALAVGLLPARRDPMPDYRATLAQVERAVPAGRSIMGVQTFWFGIPDRQYFSWEQLVYYQLCVPGSSLTDALEALRPDMFIIDRDMESFAIADDKSQLTESGQSLYLPKAELDAFLDQRARLVANISTRTFGDVRIYEIDWSRR
jgi:4-amino-4-deoxy-L-arabinose transferase-like glycosyltransferase